MNPSKRPSSQVGVDEDPRPYLVNLSQDSCIKNDRITITGDEFHVGRSPEADFNIPHELISRKQCVLKKELDDKSESTWFLHHLGSSSSWVNARKVKQGDKVTLKNEDVIEFSDLRKFSFNFYCPDVEVERKRAKIALEEEEEKAKEEEKRRQQEALTAKLLAMEQEKMEKEKAERELEMQERIKMLEAKYSQEKEELERKILSETLEKQKLLEEKLAEERVRLEEKLEQEKSLAEQKFITEKLQLEDKLKGLEEIVKKKEEEKLKKEEERKQLEEEAEKIKATLAEKEAVLKLTAEQLKKDGEYEENIKKMTEELDKVKSDLIQNLDKQSLLEKQLQDTAGSSYLAAKTEFMESFGEVVETELQCSICNELYIEAMMLNCMHTFCAYCLNKWKKRKKECPVCRAKIKSENRAFIWDSFIDKMVSKLSDDLQQRRRQLIAERAGGRQSASTSQTATPTPIPVVNVPRLVLNNGAILHPVSNNGTPRIINAPTIRIAVPVSNAGAIASAHPSLARGPNIRGPNLSGVRVLGSIDLTQGRAQAARTPPNAHSGSARPSPTTVQTPRACVPASRATPVAYPHGSSSSTRSDSPRSRRSSRLRDKRRQRQRQSAPLVPDEVINLEAPGVSGPIIIDDAVIEIEDEPSTTNTSTLDNNSARRRIDLSPTNSPQPSTSGAGSGGPSTSSGTRSSTKRKRLSRNTTILISSDSDSSSDDSDSSSSSVEGFFDYEYSGGRCWDCGRRGHWARACPDTHNC